MENGYSFTMTILNYMLEMESVSLTHGIYDQKRDGFPIFSSKYSNSLSKKFMMTNAIILFIEVKTSLAEFGRRKNL